MLVTFASCKRHEASMTNSVTTSSSPSVSVSESEPAAGVASAADSASASVIASASAAPSASISDARKAAIAEARDFGMLGLIDPDAGGVSGGIVGGTIGAGTSFGHAPPPRGARVRLGTLTVNGRLPPEVITRIIRQNLGRFRLCYENGLRFNPSLTGRVTTTFVIDRSGAVSIAKDSGSDMPDQGVTNCVVRGHANLSFPQPEGGIVTVVSPIMFSPGS